MNTRLGFVVAGGLVAAILLSIIAIAALSALEVDVPGVFDDVVKISLGALAALLARVGGTDDVRVTNPASAPIPTQDVPE